MQWLKAWSDSGPGEAERVRVPSLGVVTLGSGVEPVVFGKELFGKSENVQEFELKLFKWMLFPCKSHANIMQIIKIVKVINNAAFSRSRSCKKESRWRTGWSTLGRGASYGPRS